jgi:hypothetical protein
MIIEPWIAAVRRRTGQTVMVVPSNMVSEKPPNVPVNALHSSARMARATASPSCRPATTSECQCTTAKTRPMAILLASLFAALTAVEQVVALLSAAPASRVVEHTLARTDLLRSKIAAMYFGEPERIEAADRCPLARMEHLGEQQGLAEGWGWLSDAAWLRSDRSAADEHSRQALAIYERIGDQDGIAAIWSERGSSALLAGALQQAEEYVRHAQPFLVRSGNQQGLGTTWGQLGNLADERGDLDRADWYDVHGGETRTHLDLCAHPLGAMFLAHPS